MKNSFPELTFPFVYLDSSFLHRTNNVAVQKLTRNLLTKNSQRFHALLDELIVASKADYSYYERIIHLQQENVISTVVTYEALNSALAVHSPSVISLFGNINNTLPISSLRPSYSFEDLVLWDENVKVKPYIAAAIAILNSSCVVADAAFLSLSIGRSLAQYVTSDCVFCILKFGGQLQNYGGNSVVYELPPKKFIQILHSQL